MPSSQKSQSGPLSSGYASSLSPTSTFSYHGAQSPTSPVEESFFGAIASKMRRGRSRSRPRTRGSRDRSKSPMMLPPEHLPSSSSSAQAASPTYMASRPQQPRHVSSASQSSVMSTGSQPSRPSLQGSSRQSSDMWRGRHSNDWLFNGYSVTGHAKEILKFGKDSRA
ncbi:hypothetical protein GQ43DRAFT_467647 [Delitschia confertaspora ATCC 74209]|uniref:Uncharacterized protein n=1 Tax=Delitschia confertaspora ATCC 74209 TaxID=1513339 RepID=A0A9P4MXB1_9PLEO|nr:hypothetical protein GQ43DRAFT_467647 [Delitschia confertaspora ATCC 74209]